MLKTGLVARDFQHGHVTHQIGGDVGKRVFQRIAHTRLGREVDDTIDVPMVRHHRLHGLVISDIDLVEAERLKLKYQVEDYENNMLSNQGEVESFSKKEIQRLKEKIKEYEEIFAELCLIIEPFKRKNKL